MSGNFTAMASWAEVIPGTGLDLAEPSAAARGKRIFEFAPSDIRYAVIRGAIWGQNERRGHFWSRTGGIVHSGGRHGAGHQTNHHTAALQWRAVPQP